MRIIAVTRVKNEADIIEAFVRHACKQFDEILIHDDDSTDLTVNILTLLKEEGLRIHVRTTKTRNTQSFDITSMMREAFIDMGADWVLPLDADEFVETLEGVDLKDILTIDARLPVKLYWNNFAFPDDFKRDGNPVQEIRLRNAQRSELPKICVPRALGLDRSVSIYEGNHFLARGRNRVIDKCGSDAVDCVICHYPIRSLEQYIYKVSIGTFRYIMAPSLDRSTFGWHYEEAFKLLLAGDKDELHMLARETALTYSSNNRDISVIERPLRYLGGELKYKVEPMTEADVLRGVIAFTHSLAIDHHNIKTDGFLKRLRRRLIRGRL